MPEEQNVKALKFCIFALKMTVGTREKITVTSIKSLFNSGSKSCTAQIEHVAEAHLLCLYLWQQELNFFKLKKGFYVGYVESIW